MAGQSPQENRLLGPLAVSVTMVFVIALAILQAADLAMDRIINSTIRDRAERDARHWADALVGNAPDLESFVAGNDAHREEIMATVAGAITRDVFKTNLFAPDGQPVLTSTEADAGFELITQDDRDTALLAFETGMNITRTVIRDHALPARDHYVETYILTRDAAGTPFGVVEIYVDVSDTYDLLHSSFQGLNRSLIFGSALAYLLPSLFVVLRGQQLRRRDQKLAQLSRFDPVTGVLNRREFSRAAEQLFSDRRADEVIGVTVVELDGFRLVNLEFGQVFGDNLLRHTTKTITTAAGSDAIIGRIGADKFMVLHPFANAAKVDNMCLKILRRMRRPLESDGATITPSVRIGTHLSKPGESATRGMQSCDLALIHAKKQGRSAMIRFSEEMEDARQRRKYVESVIRTSLDTNTGFSINFQPIFRDGNGTLAGFESLLRLRDAHGTQIPPSEFIAVAEDTGLIGEVGRYSLDHTLAVARHWPAGLFVSVNLSAAQFLDGQIVKTVQIALIESEFDPARLELEVTESLLLEGEKHVSQQLAGLKSLGSSLALDDFGSGYSSLGYLWKYDFDKIKIDRMFLQGFDMSSEKYLHVVKTIVRLGQNLGMSITVEGVERPEQLKILQDMGCDMFQGYLLGRPVDVDAANALVARSQQAQGLDQAGNTG